MEPGRVVDHGTEVEAKASSGTRESSGTRDKSGTREKL